MGATASAAASAGVGAASKRLGTTVAAEAATAATAPGNDGLLCRKVLCYGQKSCAGLKMDVPPNSWLGCDNPASAPLEVRIVCEDRVFTAKANASLRSSITEDAWVLRPEGLPRSGEVREDLRLGGVHDEPDLSAPVADPLEGGRDVGCLADEDPIVEVPAAAAQWVA